MELYCIDNETIYDVVFTKKAGNQSVLCPVCTDSRKNKSKKDFSFNISKGCGECWNCGYKFVKSESLEKKPEYIKPVFNNTDLSDNAVLYFEKRGITKRTIIEMRITEQLEYMPQINKKANCICFNYFRNDELINTKFRDGAKHFKLVKDAELIPYNLDNLKDQTECIWCEGEFDQLSFYEAGFKNSTSVPNGAGKQNQNLTYIDNVIDEIEHIQVHYIATDNDEPGRKLKDELIRRFGSEKCKTVDLKDCKDANEFLIKYGVLDLRDCIKNAKDVPLSGIYSVDDDLEGIIDLWEHGMPPGLYLKHRNLNELISWVSSSVAIFTGIPSHGKSEVVDEVCEQLNILHGWKTAYFSPENWPTKIHVSKIVSRIIGKRFGKRDIDKNVLLQTLNYVKENFFFIYPEDEDLSIHSILNHAKSLIKRKGIKILVIDPWNKLEHKRDRGDSETEYVSKTLDVIDVFAKRNDVLVIVVAHPTKMKKDAAGDFEVPTLYDINGSANWYNKAFYGLCVYRKSDCTEIHVQKVKFKHLGATQGGMVRFEYFFNSGRYAELNRNREFEDDDWIIGSHLQLNSAQTVIEPPKEVQPNTQFENVQFTDQNNETPF